MKARHIIIGAAALAGLCNGALGNRFLIRAPDIYRVDEMMLPEIAMAIPAFLLMAWAAVAVFGRYSLFFFYLFLSLGIYALFYGLFESLAHSLNHKPMLSSVSIFLLGSALVLSLFFANKIFSNRVRST